MKMGSFLLILVSGLLGVGASSFVPEEQSEEVPPAVSTVEDRGPVDTLVGLLADQPEVRAAAAAALKEMGETPSMVEAVKDPNRKVRITAIQELEGVEEAFEALLAALDDPDSGVRTAAAESLGAFPAHVDRIVPALAGVLEGDENWEAQKAAARSLGHLGPKAAEGVAALASAAESPKSGPLRIAAIEALGKIGSSEARTALTKLLENQKWESRIAAADALGEIGPEAKSALPALLKACTDKGSPSLRAAAASAVGKISRS